MKRRGGEGCEKEGKRVEMKETIVFGCSRRSSLQRLPSAFGGASGLGDDLRKVWGPKGRRKRLAGEMRTASRPSLIFLSPRPSLLYFSFRDLFLLFRAPFSPLFPSLDLSPEEEEAVAHSSHSASRQMVARQLVVQLEAL